MTEPKMEEFQRAAIRHSLQDVIHILENEPVQGDLIVLWPIVETMNRVSIAHLSVERGMKFLITAGEGPLIEEHDLHLQLQQMRKYDPESARFLEQAFEEAVNHYQCNPNKKPMKHLKTLDSYLSATGSNQAFQNIRYWELEQSLDEVLIRQIHLSLHIEILHGLSEILRAPDMPKGTVLHRVERAVRDAMWPIQELRYGPGTEKERSVESYKQWLGGYSSFREAIAEAFRHSTVAGDDFKLKMLNNAYKTLWESKDPAVRYFADTLIMLPTQSRDAIPCVEWLGPDLYQAGKVSTPAGEVLGFIDRRRDGMWSISPTGYATVRVAAKAETQTDARCFLASLLTRPARAIVNGDERNLRIVGEENDLFKRNYDQVANWYEGTDSTQWPTYEVAFWDDKHGITGKDGVKLEVPSTKFKSVVDVLEGTVTGVAGHKVFISGIESVEWASRPSTSTSPGAGSGSGSGTTK